MCNLSSRLLRFATAMVLIATLSSCGNRLLFPAGMANTRITAADRQGLNNPPLQIPLRNSYGWHFKSSPQSADVVIMFHGNAETIDDYAHWASEIAGRGLDVLLVEYPGYRTVPGKPSQKTIRTSATTAFDRMRQAGYKQENIKIFGRSIGAAVALDLTEQREIKNLILVSPFTSLADTARLNGLPKSLALGRFDSRKAIENYSGNLQIIHGTHDEILPFTMGQELHRAAGSPEERKSIVPLNAGHNDLMSRHQKTLTNLLLEDSR